MGALASAVLAFGAFAIGAIAIGRRVIRSAETSMLPETRVIVVCAALCLLGAKAMAADGLTTLLSSYGPKETMTRLEAAVEAKGLTVFGHVDHAAGAADVGLALRPTDLLIFGNAKGGTPLMQSVQTTGIDLPLKVLVWQDASGDTWLSYNDPAWIAKRHGTDREVDGQVRAMAALLDAITKTAAGVAQR